MSWDGSDVDEMGIASSSTRLNFYQSIGLGDLFVEKGGEGVCVSEERETFWG